MWKIKWLTPKEKLEGKKYIWKFKTESHKNLLRKHILFVLEETPNQYYLMDDKVVIADYATTAKGDTNNAVFDFAGYGTYIGSEKKDGKPDSWLRAFYKKNPDKIPDFHKHLFENLIKSQDQKK